MAEEYVTFVEELKDLAEGKELQLFIRYLTPGPKKYDCRHVKAIVSSSPDKLPQGDVLWLRFWNGVLHPQPWAIKITQELPEFTPGRHRELLRPRE